jgi:hypothetical protein
MPMIDYHYIEFILTLALVVIGLITLLKNGDQ